MGNQMFTASLLCITTLPGFTFTHNVAQLSKRILQWKLCD